MSRGPIVRNQNGHLESSVLQPDLERGIFKVMGFKILSFLSSTSLLLTVNGVMVVIFGFLLYGSIIDPILLSTAFLVTFGVYGLNKFTDKNEDSINRPEILANTSKYYLVFSVGSMLIGFLIGLLESILAFVFLFVPVIVGIVYSVQFTKSIPRLKEIVGIKSLVVAISWSLTGSLLPASLCHESVQVIAIFFIYIFIKIFVGTILCDVLDIKGDLAAGIETIPTRLLKKKTKRLLLIVNTFGILLIVYCIVTGTFLKLIPALLFGVLYGYLAIWYFFRKNCKRLTAGLMLDGEWLPIVIMGLFLI